jgi:hypothetical protein
MPYAVVSNNKRVKPFTAPPVGLTSTKQLGGRFVRVTGSKALGLWYDNAIRLNREWWAAQPDLKHQRDARFFAGAAEHDRWPRLSQFTCCAIVRGKRCNRISIVETQHRHCIKHAGPAAARRYRENCYKLFLSGRYPSWKWFKDEARRARTAITDRQRRKRNGWVLPGLTVRFSPEIETRFQVDVAFVLQGRSWDAVPDYHRDQLRWGWRKFQLDRQKPAAWDGKARSVMLDLDARGPVEVDDLAHATGHEPHVLPVDRRCTAFSWRSRVSPAEIERALAAPVEAQKAIARRKRPKRSGAFFDAPDGDPGAASDQGVAPRPARLKAATSEAETDRLLQLHGRDLRKVLAEVDEAAWPKLLRAYDGFVRNPTGPSHRIWMAVRGAASI